MGFPIDNDEQKIRISLSEHAMTVMKEDMEVFLVKQPATFINTVFSNFRDDAFSSLSAYLERKRSEYSRIFEKSELSDSDIEAAIKCLLTEDKLNLEAQIRNFLRDKAASNIFHLNKDNLEYLLSDECPSDKIYNNKASSYVKCVIEEYTSKPFIERVRIFKKDVYEAVERAYKLREVLEITVAIDDKKTQTFLVHPYKIISDPLHTQDYLACFTRQKGESPKQKRIASFAMARLTTPKILKQEAFISRADKTLLEKSISQLSAAFLLGEPEKIEIRLTEKGKQIYRNKLHLRPVKDKVASTDDVYVFYCSEMQAYNYFFAFGQEAEILSPVSLRQRFINGYRLGMEHYIK